MSQGYFKYQRPNDMLKDLYRINDKKKNSKLLNVIKSGLSDFKNETENMGEKKKKLKNQMRYWMLLKKFLSLTNKIKKDMDSKYQHQIKCLVDYRLL